MKGSEPIGIKECDQCLNDDDQDQYVIGKIARITRNEACVVVEVQAEAVSNTVDIDPNNSTFAYAIFDKLAFEDWYERAVEYAGPHSDFIGWWVRAQADNESMDILSLPCQTEFGLKWLLAGVY